MVLRFVRTCRIDKERHHVYYTVMLDVGRERTRLSLQSVYYEDGLLLVSLIYESWHNTVLHFIQDFAVMP